MTDLTFQTLFEEAEALRTSGDFEAALSKYLELIEDQIMEAASGKIEFNQIDTSIIERIADIKWLYNETNETNQLLEIIIDLIIPEKNPFLFLYVTIKKSLLLLYHANCHEAFENLNSISAFIGDPADIPATPLLAWEHQCDLQELTDQEYQSITSLLYYFLGLLKASLGEYHDALAYLKQCIHKSNQGNNQQLLRIQLPAQLAIGNALMEKGEIDESYQQLEQIQLQYDLMASLNNHLIWLELSGKIALLNGQYQRSIEYYERIYAICYEHKIPHAAIMSIINLASIRIHLNQVYEAENLLDYAKENCTISMSSYFIRRIEQLKELAQERTSGSPVIPTIIELQNRIQENHVSEKHFDNVIPPLEEQSQNYLLFFEERAFRFQFLLAARQWDEAFEFLTHIEQVFAYTDSSLIIYKIAMLRFMLHYYTDQLDLLEFNPLEIGTYFKQQDLKPDLWQFNRFVSWSNLIDEPLKQEVIKENARILNELTSGLPKQEQGLFLSNKWIENERYLIQEVDKMMALAPKFEEITIDLSTHNTSSGFIHQAGKVIRLIDFYKKAIVDRVIKKSDHKIESEGGMQLLTVLESYPADMVGISFLVLSDATYIFCIGLDIFGVIEIKISRSTLRSLIRQWHGQVITLRNLYVTNYLQPTGTLVESQKKVIEITNSIAGTFKLSNIFSLLPKRISRINFVPDDALHNFPFAALQHEGEYIIKKYALQINFETYKPIYENKVNLKNILLAGVSKRISERLSALPGVQVELNLLQELWTEKNKETTLLLNENLNKQILFTTLQEVDLAHIACHGSFYYRDPYQSGLFFLNDEKFSLKDILEQPIFKNLKHITLSACWAADRYILPGRWIISLPETFYRSGVKNILGNYWEVSDEMAINFMKRFYQLLETLPSDLALQQCQIEAMENNSTSNLWCWCGYNLFGTPQHYQFNNDKLSTEN